MHVRWRSRVGFSMVWALSGCAALQSAQSGVQGAQSGVESTTGTVKGAEETAGKLNTDAKEHADKAKGLKGGKGGGGAGGAADPDGDGGRAQAKEGKTNEAITDELDRGKGDLADWKVFDLSGRPGLLTVQLHWDEAAADLNVDVFDSFGANIAASPGKSGQPMKKLLAQVDQPGKYYVRISSASGGSVYTFMARWAGGGGAPAMADKGQIPPPAVPGGAAAPAAAPASPDDPDHPRAKIVQSYREDNQMVLYLDKGSAANIKAGMNGFILEGAEGDKPLDGGTFRVTSVVGPTKSVAKSSVPKVGKNTRCVINLR